MDNIGWKFPILDGGDVKGINDEGVDRFLDDPLGSLAREIPQNSLDAVPDDSDLHAEVRIDMLKIDSKEFPGIDEFRQCIQSGYEYWKNRAEKESRFFREALEVISSDKIPVLRLSDYNTTGLQGFTEVEHPNSDWGKLIKCSGLSDKASGGKDGLGSFGIGKWAPFANSTVRTVFYSTRDINGDSAFQGKSVLCTHRNLNGDLTVNKGYYGDKNGNLPIIGTEGVPAFFWHHRASSAPGADIFIVGFKYVDDWEENISKSIIENFFPAIQNDKLHVSVGNTTIRAQELPALIESFSKNNEDFLVEPYYRTLVDSSIHKFEENISGLGQMELSILKGDGYPKKVKIFRSTGMIIETWNFRVTTMKFVGTLRTMDTKANAFLRELEPPEHNAFKYYRYVKDPIFAKNVLRNLRAWMRDKIKEVAGKEQVQGDDLPGMSQFLPDENAFDITKPSSNIESDLIVPKKAEIIVKNPASGQNINSISFDDGDDDTLNAFKTNDEDQYVGEGDDFGEDGGGHGNNTEIENPGGGTGEFPGDGGQGGNDMGDEGELEREVNAQKDEIKEKTKGKQKISSKNIEGKPRIFCTNPNNGEYRLKIMSKKDGLLIFGVRAVGEDFKGKLSIMEARSNEGEKLNIIDGLVGPYEIAKNQQYTLNLLLEDKIRCALEVIVHEGW